MRGQRGITGGGGRRNAGEVREGEGSRKRIVGGRKRGAARRGAMQ